jgi:hypothetical protein
MVGTDRWKLRDGGIHALIILFADRISAVEKCLTRLTKPYWTTFIRVRPPFKTDASNHSATVPTRIINDLVQGRGDQNVKLPPDCQPNYWRFILSPGR